MVRKLMDLQNFSVYFDHQLLGDLEGVKLMVRFTCMYVCMNVCTIAIHYSTVHLFMFLSSCMSSGTLQSQEHP